MTEAHPTRLTGEANENGKRLAGEITGEVQQMLWATLAAHMDQDGGESGVMEGFLHGFVCVAWELRRKSDPALEAALPLRDMFVARLDEYLAHLNATHLLGGEAKGNA